MLRKSGGLYFDRFVLTLESAREATSVVWVTAGWMDTNIVLDNGTPTTEFWLQPVLLLLDILEWASMDGTNVACTNGLMGVIWHIECLLPSAAFPANCPGVSVFCRASFWLGLKIRWRPLIPKPISKVGGVRENLYAFDWSEYGNWSLGQNQCTELIEFSVYRTELQSQFCTLPYLYDPTDAAYTPLTLRISSAGF